MEEGHWKTATAPNEATIGPGNQRDLLAATNSYPIGTIAITHLPVGLLVCVLALCSEDRDKHVLPENNSDWLIRCALQMDTGDLTITRDKSVDKFMRFDHFALHAEAQANGVLACASRG